MPSRAEAGLWRGGAPILLASTSLPRRALLEAAGLPVETEASGLDERALESSLGAASPAEIAARLAEAKALSVSGRRPGRIVVGADQTLSLDGEMFHKAMDAAEACRHLARLSGRTHRLVSAVAIAWDGHVVGSFLEQATLTMRSLGEEAILDYVAIAGESVTRSVGCYEVEGVGVHLFDQIEGEHASILGLPILPLLAEFRRAGWLAW